ncbi:MAG: WG repeat-containing protein [Clostridia bacterium]
MENKRFFYGGKRSGEETSKQDAPVQQQKHDNDKAVKQDVQVPQQRRDNDRIIKQDAPATQQKRDNDRAVKYDSAKLNLQVGELALCDSTKELLAKFHVATAADIVKRSEREMYKIQGLNKKILFEVKGAIEKEGMAFRIEEPKPQKPQINAQKGGAEASRIDSKNSGVNANGAQNSNVRRDEKPFSDNRNRSDRNAEINKIDGRNDRNRDNRRDVNADEKSRLNSRGDRNDRNRDNNARNDDRNRQKPANIVAPRPVKLTAPLPVEEWKKIQKGGKWGFYDGFKTVVPSMYDEVFSFKDGLASVELDEKCGYIDCNNNIIIPFDYDTAMSFQEGYACVYVGIKCGYINKNNEVVIPFEYDAGTQFEDGEAKIKKDGKWGTITPDGVVKWI